MKENTLKPSLEFNGEPLTVSFRRYPNNNRIAMELISMNDHMPYMVATVNVPSAHLEEGELLIKNYSENEGILEKLEEAGYVKRTGREIQTGFVTVPVCKLLLPLKTL